MLYLCKQNSFVRGNDSGRRIKPKVTVGVFLLESSMCHKDFLCLIQVDVPLCGEIKHGLNLVGDICYSKPRKLNFHKAPRRHSLVAGLAEAGRRSWRCLHCRYQARQWAHGTSPPSRSCSVLTYLHSVCLKEAAEKASSPSLSLSLSACELITEDYRRQSGTEPLLSALGLEHARPSSVSSKEFT